MDLSWMLEPPFDDLFWFVVTVGACVIGLFVIAPVFVFLVKLFVRWVEWLDDWIL